MDSRGFAFAQDLFCVMVAMISVSLLIVDLASTFAASEERSAQQELDEDARRVCEEFLQFDPVLWKGERGMLEEGRLDALDVEIIRDGLRVDFGFSLSIVAVADGGGRSWSWSTGPPAQDRGACVTSASLRGSGGRISPARVVLWAWRD
jgi:hypothetical protein